MTDPIDSRIAQSVADRFKAPPPSLENRVASRYLYARRFFAMSMQEAKSILGFPPSASPSPDEINKAWKSKAFENHPDRGGDAEKMRDINVAKDVLTGKSRATWTPEPPPERPKREPPKVVDTIPGVTFSAAVSKSGVPANTEWKCISKPQYAPTKGAHTWSNYIWTLIGVTDQKIWVLSVKLRTENKYFDPVANGLVEVEPDWQANLVSMPRDKDPLKMLPKLVRSPSVLFEDSTVADPPKKWVLWEGGDRVTEMGVKKVKYGSGGANLKDVLAMSGIVKGDAAGVANRKSTVEIIPHYSLEKGKRVRQEQGGKLYTYQAFEYEVRINGKSADLADDTVKNLEKNGFIIGVFNYDPPDNKPKQLHKLRGGRFGTSPGVAIRLLADSLTSEPSWLHIALEKAAEEWEVEDVKTASYEDEETSIVNNVVARYLVSSDDEKAKKKLLMAIYKRMPIGNKHLRGGKHVIMFSGPSAKAYGVENYATVTLEDLSMEELEKAAKAVGAK